MKRILLVELLTVVALTINAQSTVTDCQGHTYPVVKIGNQYWMAENLQCTKYDTQSEMAGRVLSSDNTREIGPFYNDPKNVTNKFCDYITAEHRKKFGLLYNYAAAMGFDAYQANAQDGTYQGRRQGICPNGFHIPSTKEWLVLIEYCGGKDIAATDLKTTTGWHNGSNSSVPGTNSTGFSALPVSSFYNKEVTEYGSKYGVFGANAIFITTDVRFQEFVNCPTMITESFVHMAARKKYWAVPVRCIKN